MAQVTALSVLGVPGVPQTFSAKDPASEFPETILLNDLLDNASTVYPRGNMKFNISGTSFIWRDNQLLEVGGSNKYILYDNVMVLQ